MPLYNFIKILVSNDLSYIGKGTQAQLEEAWENIFSEYMSLSKDGTQNHLLGVIKEIAILENKLFLIQTIVDELSKEWNEALAKCLNALGFRYKYTLETLEKDLKLTVTNAKSLILRLDQRKNDLKALQSGSSSPTESDFDALLIELSKFMGYRINTKEVTISEFIALQNNYKAANKPKNGK